MLIEKEPRGETYQALLRFASSRCQSFSLVWRDQFKFDPPALEVAATLMPHLLSEVHTNTWPGTRLGGKAIVRYYRLSKRSVTVLRSVDGLYSWLYPELPEDIAFYSSERVVWLGTISHEQDSWFADASLTRKEIPENVPGIELGTYLPSS